MQPTGTECAQPRTRPLIFWQTEEVAVLTKLAIGVSTEPTLVEQPRGAEMEDLGIEINSVRYHLFAVGSERSTNLCEEFSDSRPTNFVQIGVRS